MKFSEASNSVYLIRPTTLVAKLFSVYLLLFNANHMAFASNSIKMINMPSSLGQSIFIFSAETPFDAYSKLTTATNQTIITIKGPDIGGALLKFFNGRVIYGENPCIKNISVTPISDTESKINVTYTDGVEPHVEIKDSETDSPYTLTVSLATKAFANAKCTALLAKNHKELRWSQRPIFFSGNIMLDAAYPKSYSGTINEDDLGFDEHWELRRLKFDAKGIYLNWRYQFRFDFSDTLNDEEIELVRALISYIGWHAWEIRFGLIPESFGLENSASSKHLTFMERAPLGTIIMEDNLGISAAYTPSKQLYLQFGAFKKRAYPGTSKTKSSITGRVSYAPVNKKGKVWYLGTSLSTRQPVDGKAKYRVRPASHLADRIFRTSTIDPIDRIDVGNLEFAIVRGSLSAQAEYMQAKHRLSDAQKDQNLTAAYVMVSWFITGESRPYRRGAFGRIKPKRRFGKGWGAWELAVRNSWIDDDRGEELKDLTLGVNWYLNKKIRFMANLVRTEHVTPTGIGNAEIIQARGQYNF